MQNHTLEKATAEEEVPIFGEVGQGFTFAPKIVDKQQKMGQTWLANQQEPKQASTPGTTSSVVQSMQNENILPPSLQLFADLIQNMTPQNISPAATSQEMSSQTSHNSDDRKTSYHRNLTPRPADIPTLRQIWLSRPQSDDPKETRNTLSFSMLL